MRKTGPRWHGFAVPLACGVGVILRGWDVEASILMLVSYYGVNLLSLGAAQAFSRAAAKQLSTKKVMGSLVTAMMMIGAAAAALTALTRSKWPLAAGMLAAVMVIEELFVTQGDPTSARMTDILTAIGLSAALLIPGNQEIYCMIAGGCALGVSSLIAAGFSRKEWPRPNWGIFKEIPVGLLRTALYPACWLALWAVARSDYVGIGALPGLILMEMCRTTFMRDRSEAAGFRATIGALAAAFAGAILIFNGFLDPVWMMELLIPLEIAVGCAILLYGSLDWRILTGAILSGGVVGIFYMAQTSMIGHDIAGYAIAALAAIVNLMLIPDWREVLRLARVRKIKRRAMRAR